ncbi:MAG TPA: beta/gamma crystallin-related protein [Chloroflexota bacterium]|nr:beta/gamma crystallin-related protein [Chloroflexota bacterium]
MSTDYLHRGFIDTVWPQATDLLSNEIVHGAWLDADKQGFDLHVSETSLDMAALPRFTLASGQLKLRFPGTGSYRFKTHVVRPLPGPIPDVGTTVTAKLSAEMTIDNVEEPVVNVGVGLDSGPVGDVADWFTSWEDELKGRVRQGFGARLGFFSTARYDTSVAVTVSAPELVYGDTGLDSRKSIDIVLVSDGFTTANMGQFRTVVEAFTTQLTTASASRGNEPYYSFRSVIRIWKMEVPSAVPGHLSHRIVTGYFDAPSGSRKTALANLARLARIGLKAEAVDPDVVVFMSDRATFGGDARAMAMGSVVMLPVSGASADGDASVLLHEIGHSTLGNLADEYIEDVGVPHDAVSSIRHTAEAANASAAKVDGEAILFADLDFRGAHKHVFAAEGRLDFADRASSVVVLAGSWQLYRDADFRQPYPPVLGPGLYANLAALGVANDTVSALRPTAARPTATGAPFQGQVVLHEHSGFRGAHQHVFGNAPRVDFGDRVSSLAVLSGSWQLFRDADFRQPFTPVFGPGAYPNASAAGVANDTVSALRPTAARPTATGTPLQGQVVLFEHSAYRGVHKHIYGPEPRLDMADRTSSIAVLAGSWRVYQDNDFNEPYSPVLGRGLYPALERPYHGKEPQAPNVTAERPSADGAAPRKWARWAQSPARRPFWDTFPIESFQGARYHGAGLWRPADNCKMRHSLRDTPFCAVCREALTLGIRQVLGPDVFLVEYTYPSRDETRRAQVGPADASGKLVHHLRVPESGSIEVRGKLVAGTLPEPWTIHAVFTGTGPKAIGGPEWSFTGRQGDVLRLTISSASPFVPFNPLPALTVELRCDLPLRDAAPAARGSQVPQPVDTRR